MGWVEEEEEVEEHKTKKIVVAYTKDLLSISNYYLSLSFFLLFTYGIITLMLCIVFIIIFIMLLLLRSISYCE